MARHEGGIRAALIDLDGTLLDTAADIAAAGNAMLADAGRSPLSREVAASYVGKGAATFVARALSDTLDASADAVTVERWLPVFLRHYAQHNGRLATLYDGVIRGLDAMRGLGLRLAVVTNKPRALTVPLLEQFKLAPYFAAVVAGGDTERRKPDPQPLLHACTLLGVAARDAIMIGDSVNDVEAARAAGCRALVLPYGYNEGRPVHGLASDGIVASLFEAAEFIRGTQLHTTHV